MRKKNGSSQIRKTNSKKTERKNIEKKEPERFEIDPNKKLNHKDFWKQVPQIFEENNLIYGETGTPSQALGEVTMPKGTKYIASSVWGAIGFTLSFCHWNGLCCGGT